jgi:hypothetical protein
MGLVVAATYARPMLSSLYVINLAVSTIGALGLFGYAWRRRLFRRGLWRAWTVIQPVRDSFGMWVAVPMGLGAGGAPEGPSVAYRLAVLAFLLPLYIALFRYGFRSETLWSQRARLS